MCSAITTASVNSTLFVFFKMDFKVAFLILSLSLVSYGFSHGDENHKGGESRRSREFSSRPLDPRAFGSKSSVPTKFGLRQLGLDKHKKIAPGSRPDRFAPKHHVPKSFSPLKPSLFKSEKHGPKHFEREVFGPRHVVPHRRSLQFGPRHVKLEGFGAIHVGSEGFESVNVKPGHIKPERSGAIHGGPRHVGPEGFREINVGPRHVKEEIKVSHIVPQRFEAEVLDPRHFGAEGLNYDNFKFDNYGPGSAKPDYYSPDESDLDNYKYFDHSQFNDLDLTSV